MEDLYNNLSFKDCVKIIQTALNDTTIKVISYEINPFSDNIQGFMGQHFRIQIKYGNEGVKTKNFFMKVLNGSLKTIFDLCMSLNAYEKEEFFYSIYLNELKKINVKLDCFPRCYLCKPYLIVLEDLSEKGYTSAHAVDLDTCKEALNTIAKFHCSSILYEAHKSEVGGTTFSLILKYPNVLRNVFVPQGDNLAKLWLSKSVEGLYEVIKILPENDITNEVFGEKLREFATRALEINENFQGASLCTILHGDPWNNNFLYKYQNEKPYDSVLLDFQLISYGPPSLDVMHFIFANTRKKFRDSNLEYLIDHYYGCVQNCLTKHGYTDIPERSKYLFSNDVKAYTKLICICDRSVTLMSSEIMSSTLENDESFRRYLFEDRGVNLVNSYMVDKKFREIIEEDLLELRDILFDRS